jgi:hypothetical protein
VRTVNFKQLCVKRKVRKTDGNHIPWNSVTGTFYCIVYTENIFFCKHRSELVNSTSEFWNNAFFSTLGTTLRTKPIHCNKSTHTEDREHGHTLMHWIGFKTANRCFFALGLRAVIPIGFKHKETARRTFWCVIYFASVQNSWQKRTHLVTPPSWTSHTDLLWVTIQSSTHPKPQSGPKTQCGRHDDEIKIRGNDDKTSTLQPNLLTGPSRQKQS